MREINQRLAAQKVLKDLLTHPFHFASETVKLREVVNLLKGTQLSLIPRSRAKPRQLITLTNSDPKEK